MADRPNILYVFTDQQSAFAMSCMGNDDLSTPAMDSLAETGTLFRNAYCTQPLCTPARASMFTGLMPHQCGTCSNDGPIDETLRPRELGRVLSDAGYECAYGGKWHVPESAMPEQNDHGFRTICGFNDNQLAQACVSFFREGRSRPFFLVASFDNPHNICEWGRSQCLPWGSIGRPPSPGECPDLPVNFAVPEHEPEIVRIEQRCNWALYPTTNYAEADWRRYRWAYYRLVEKVDREIGRILDGLREAGLEKDTVVMFSSDHGDGNGAHQWNQKSILYEEVVRVPMIISWPGVTRPGRQERQFLVSGGLDLYPTVCDYASVTPPEGLQGRSLRRFAEGEPVGQWRDAVFAETLFYGSGYGTTGRMVRSRRYKYVCYDRGKYREQLFDIEHDSVEVDNLAVDQQYYSVMEDHRNLLLKHMEATGDPFRQVPGHHDGHGWR